LNAALSGLKGAKPAAIKSAFINTGHAASLGKNWKFQSSDGLGLDMQIGDISSFFSREGTLWFKLCQAVAIFSSIPFSSSCQAKR